MMAQVSTPQRPPSTTQGTPTNIMPPQQAQFSTPQPMSQGQTPTTQHQPQMGVATPQTPTFSSNPASSMAAPSSAVPMSPTTESLEKERFALLLDINHELLYESIQIQTTQQELKKEFVAVNGNVPDRKPTEEESHFQHDYLQYVSHDSQTSSCSNLLMRHLVACDDFKEIYHTWLPWPIENQMSNSPRVHHTLAHLRSIWL